MRPTFSLILLLVTFVSYGIIASSCADSIPNGMSIRGSANVQRQLSSSTATTNADEEERIGFSGLNKLKNLIRGNTKSAATLEKSSTVMKEVEGLKNNPVLAKGFKSVGENGVLMKRIKSLEKLDPKAVETLRKAPVEKSVRRVSSYLSRGQSFHISDEAKPVIFFISVFLIMGGVIGLAGLVVKMSGPDDI